MLFYRQPETIADLKVPRNIPTMSMSEIRYLFKPVIISNTAQACSKKIKSSVEPRGVESACNALLNRGSSKTVEDSYNYKLATATPDLYNHNVRIVERYLQHYIPDYKEEDYKYAHTIIKELNHSIKQFNRLAKIFKDSNKINFTKGIFAGKGFEGQKPTPEEALFVIANELTKDDIAGLLQRLDILEMDVKSCCIEELIFTEKGIESKENCPWDK